MEIIIQKEEKKECSEQKTQTELYRINERNKEFPTIEFKNMANN